MIGIFDSGVGGLTVAREIKKRLPDEPIVYFGDTARVPWGNKSREIVSQYSEEICNFLISRGADEIVIACNTASAFAGDYLREKYPTIRIHDVISPVIGGVVAQKKDDSKMRIGVIGTRGTVFSGIYERKIKEINPEIEVYSKACPLFVPLAEEGFGNSRAAKLIAEEYLAELKDREISKLILGCTHYPLLKKVISDFFGEGVEIFGSDEAIAEQLYLQKKSEKTKKIGEDAFYFSDLSGSYLELAKNIFGKEIKAEKINLSDQAEIESI